MYPVERVCASTEFSDKKISFALQILILLSEKIFSNNFLFDLVLSSLTMLNTLSNEKSFTSLV